MLQPLDFYLCGVDDHIQMPANSDPMWIEHADLNKGALGAKAKKAGMGTQSFAAKNTGSPGKLGKQSRLAETLSKLRGKGATK